MAKVDENAAAELPLNDERLPEKKQNRHVVIALKHMGIQRENLNKKIEALTKERDDLEASIKALS
jgi:Holliday junction resolvasome RuvABC DNA-binding subunit